MGKRRFVQLSTSDDEESPQKKAKADEERNDEEKQEELYPKPLGDVIEVSVEKSVKRNHYRWFEYIGDRYEIGDTVLLEPEHEDEKPYLAIIKDIFKTIKGPLMMEVQWLYRPEEAVKVGGGIYQSRFSRELFYSFHSDDVYAESIKHKCVVHFIPLNKQIPDHREHPGFVVQNVYDHKKKRVYKITDKDYEDENQQEIDFLVQKTVERLGDLPDLEPNDTSPNPKNQIDNKRNQRRRKMSPFDVSLEDEGLRRYGSRNVETPGRAAVVGSLRNKFLTKDTQRNKWLEKLLQSIMDSLKNGEEDNGGLDARSHTPSVGNGGSNHINDSPDKTRNDKLPVDWTDRAISAVAALEKAVHSDFQKYNQKMRQLVYNLKSNAALARRLLNRELEPVQILKMSPNELKEGLTAEEIRSRMPEELGQLQVQMTDARCARCSKEKVALNNIFRAGRDDRYELECGACGYSWFASRDDVAGLTIEGPTSPNTSRGATSASAQFENEETNLSCSHDTEKENASI